MAEAHDALDKHDSYLGIEQFKLIIRNPDKICPNHAFQKLMSDLRHLNNQLLLHKYIYENVAAKCPEPALKAIWDFAAAKAKESNKQWQSEQDACAQCQLVEKTPPARKRLWMKLHGWSCF